MSPPPKPLAAQFLKLRCRDSVGPDEEQALENACSGYKDFAAHDYVTHARQPLSCSNLLLKGYVARQIDLPDGQRQIVAIHVPGDFVDLHGFLLQELEHDIVTLTTARIALFPHSALRTITEDYPHLTRLLWLSTVLDAAIHREWMASIGRRSAKARIAHLFCELHVRLQIVGLAADRSYALPLTQTDLGDACGLTSVHVNRMLRELREEGLIDLQGRRITLLDEAGLAEVAGFDPYYLNLRAQAR